MRYLLPICFVLGLAACATSYQPEASDGGVSSTQIEQGVYAIKVQGSVWNLGDSEKRMRDFALLHAAEVCLNNGFAFFIPIETAATVNSQDEVAMKMFKAGERVPPIIFSCQMTYDSLAPQYKQY